MYKHRRIALTVSPNPLIAFAEKLYEVKMPINVSPRINPNPLTNTSAKKADEVDTSPKSTADPKDLRPPLSNANSGARPSAPQLPQPVLYG
jgi:hypothetical protein